MNKEELKQEAEKSLDKRLGTYAYIRKRDCYTNYVDGYIDGAEPREKRIAELEKKLAISEHDREHNDYELAEVYKKVSELEKENAELKNKTRFMGKQIDNLKAITRYDRLSKAKEIIREFVEWANWQGNSKCPSFKSIQDKAEQFLKDSEVEK